MKHLPPRLLTGVTVSALGHILGTAISIGTIALITRSLIRTAGVEEGIALYGAYATVLAYVGVVTIFGDGGLYLLVTREASRADAAEQRIVESAWRLRLVSGVLLSLLASVVAFTLPYSPLIQWGIVLAVWGGMFQLGSQLLMSIFQRRLRLLPPAIAEVLGRAIQGGLVLFGILHGGSVIFFLSAFVVGTLVTFLWNMIAAHALLPFRLFGSVDDHVVGRLLREAWPIALSLVLTHVFFKIDSLLLSLLRPPADVALYALPYKILESLLFFPAMMGGMLLPIFSQAATSVPNSLSSPLRSAVDLYLLGAIPMAGGLFVASPWVITLLGGASYAPSIPVLHILSITLGLLFIGNLFGNALIAVRAQRSLLWVSLLLVIVNVGANLIVIPRFSYLGAAWTTLATEVLSVALAGMLLVSRGVSIIGTERTARILLSGCVFVLLLFLPLPLLLRSLLALSGYGASVLWLRVVRPRDMLRLMRLQRFDDSSFSHRHHSHAG